MENAKNKNTELFNKLGYWKFDGYQKQRMKLIESFY